MAGEGFRVQVMWFLQFWRKWVVIMIYRCHAFVFGASADSQEPVEDRPHCITRGSSDGGTASPSDAISSGDGEWKEITIALAAESSAPPKLQTLNNIDPAGEFKVPLADEAAQPTDAAATGPSTLYQIPPPRTSLEDSKERGIITAQRTPKPAVQDVRIGKEVLVVNTRDVPFLNIKPNQLEFLNQDHVCIEVDSLYEDRFREFEKPQLENAAAGGLPVEARPSKGLAHVPPSVSEGSVSTFAIHVDKRNTTLVSILEKRRTAAAKGAKVLENFEHTSPIQKILPLENDGNGSLGQGSSSSSFI